MTNTLSISPVANNPPERASAPAATPTAAPTAPSAPTSAGNPNPTLKIDPSLGIVVIEFVNGSGSVTSSIPSQRELHAYQDGSATLPGQTTAPPAKPLAALHAATSHAAATQAVATQAAASQTAAVAAVTAPHVTAAAAAHSA